MCLYTTGKGSQRKIPSLCRFVRNTAYLQLLPFDRPYSHHISLLSVACSKHVSVLLRFQLVTVHVTENRDAVTIYRGTLTVMRVIIYRTFIIYYERNFTFTSQLVDGILSRKGMFFIFDLELWSVITSTTTTTIVLQSFVRDYPGEPVPEEILAHPPSWSSSNLYQLLPSITIHSILLVQVMCLAIFLHNHFPCPLWSTSWSGALHLIFHTFLHPISVFFSQHMPIPSQPVLQ